MKLDLQRNTMYGLHLELASANLVDKDRSSVKMGHIEHISLRMYIEVIWMHPKGLFALTNRK